MRHLDNTNLTPVKQKGHNNKQATDVANIDAGAQNELHHLYRVIIVNAIYKILSVF